MVSWAFTSTCSKHLPGFVANADKIKAKGIEQIFCLSVNDPYVMNGWGEINNTGDKIRMLSDPFLNHLQRQLVQKLIKCKRNGN